MHILNIIAGLLFQFIKIEKFVMKNIKKNYDEQENKNIEDENKKKLLPYSVQQKSLKGSVDIE